MTMNYFSSVGAHHHFGKWRKVKIIPALWDKVRLLQKLTAVLRSDVLILGSDGVCQRVTWLLFIKL